jgi:magnesium-transporting ATPase (P-type)
LPIAGFWVNNAKAMVDPALSSIADYADALITTRRARNGLFLILLLMLLFQLGLFFAARYKIPVDGSSARLDFLKYAVGLTDFLAVAAPIVLALVLLLMAQVMLVGRLLGVSRVIWAFVACIVLITLLFPWQAFLMNQTFTSTEFKIPGVLYTWSELVQRARVHPQGPMRALLYWARFVGWPAVALVLVVMIHHQSGRGLRAAFGKTPSAAPASPGARL